MLVRDYMTRHPIVIEPHQRVIEAQKMMAENKIRHLPVVGSGKRLLGLVTRQRLQIAPERLTSLEVWEITRYLAELKVEKVMVKGPDLHTIQADATLEEAADLMILHKIGGLPVVENGILIGIITEVDLLIELKNLLGAPDPGWRVTVRVPDRRGEFTKLTSTIMEHGWGIMALGSVRSPKAPGHWDIVVKVRNCTREELLPVLEAIEGHQIIDAREVVSLYSESAS